MCVYSTKAARLRGVLVRKVSTKDGERDEHEEGAVRIAQGRSRGVMAISRCPSSLIQAARSVGSFRDGTYWLLKLVLFSLVTAPLVVLIVWVCYLTANVRLVQLLQRLEPVDGYGSDTYSAFHGADEHVFEERTGVLRVSNVLERLGGILAGLGEHDLVTTGVLSSESAGASSGSSVGGWEQRR